MRINYNTGQNEGFLLSKPLPTFCTDIKRFSGLWGKDFGEDLSEPQAISFSNVGRKTNCNCKAMKNPELSKEGAVKGGA